MDWKSIGRGALIALAGAALTYASTVVVPAMEGSGNATLLTLAAFASVAVNVLRKALEQKNEVKADG
jgi:hypothetical protein